MAFVKMKMKEEDEKKKKMRGRKALVQKRGATHIWLSMSKGTTRKTWRGQRKRLISTFFFFRVLHHALLPPDGLMRLSMPMSALGNLWPSMYGLFPLEAYRWPMLVVELTLEEYPWWW